jgi:hypothetical protein
MRLGFASRPAGKKGLMGIQHQDGIKPPPDHHLPRRSDSGTDGGRAATTEEKLDAFLQRHPRFFTWLTIGLVVLVLGLLVALSLSGPRP